MNRSSHHRDATAATWSTATSATRWRTRWRHYEATTRDRYRLRTSKTRASRSANNRRPRGEFQAVLRSRWRCTLAEKARCGGAKLTGRRSSRRRREKRLVSAPFLLFKDSRMRPMYQDKTPRDDERDVVLYGELSRRFQVTFVIHERESVETSVSIACHSCLHEWYRALSPLGVSSSCLVETVDGWNATIAANYAL